eukprot:s858_g4.t1
MATSSEPSASSERQATLLDPITGLPPGWRQREKTILSGTKAGEMQQFFENDFGKKVDSIKKLMKLLCDVTGEDVEQLTQQSMAIRNPESAKSAKAKVPKAKAKADAPKAAAKVKVKEEPAKEPSEPKPSKKRNKATNGKLDPDTFLPAGWEQVEKVYKTGGSVGKTYIRFQKATGGGSHYCTINQVLRKHLEDTGEDLTAMYQEMKDRKEQEKAQRRREESEKNKELKKQQREQHIENFRAVYGALTGSLVMALPGWSGEAKLQENCRSWKLLKDIEAHFGSLMEQGKQDTFPDFDAARDSQATDENPSFQQNGRIINIARQQNQVEAWTREPKPPDPKEKHRKRKRELKMVDYGHYRETSHLKLFDVSEMTEKANLGVKFHRGSCWQLSVLLALLKWFPRQPCLVMSAHASFLLWSTLNAHQLLSQIFS